jgi:AmmeMemoRadiSam system protein B
MVMNGKIRNVLILLILVSGCEEKSHTYPYLFHPVKSVDSRDRLQEGERYGDLPDNVCLADIKESFSPYAGTISHHLLVLPVMERWFFELRTLRHIETFIMISPKHFKQGYQSISLSSLPWHTETSVVDVHTGYVKKIRKKLDLPEDREAMHFEHGIGALIPCIHRYFPGSKIVPIVIDEKNKDMAKIDMLAEIIIEIMNGDPDTFLLISIDFSHGGDSKVTAMRDRENEHYLLFPKPETMTGVYSDNFGGLVILEKTVRQRRASQCFLLCHTDSYHYSQKQPENITSYYFTYYFQKQ